MTIAMRALGGAARTSIVALFAIGLMRCEAQYPRDVGAETLPFDQGPERPLGMGTFGGQPAMVPNATPPLDFVDLGWDATAPGLWSFQRGTLSRGRLDFARAEGSGLADFRTLVSETESTAMEARTIPGGVALVPRWTGSSLEGAIQVVGLRDATVRTTLPVRAEGPIAMDSTGRFYATRSGGRVLVGRLDDATTRSLEVNATGNIDYGFGAERGGLVIYAQTYDASATGGWRATLTVWSLDGDLPAPGASPQYRSEVGLQRPLAPRVLRVEPGSRAVLVQTPIAEGRYESEAADVVRYDFRQPPTRLLGVGAITSITADGRRAIGWPLVPGPRPSVVDLDTGRISTVGGDTATLGATEILSDTHLAVVLPTGGSRTVSLVDLDSLRVSRLATLESTVRPGAWTLRAAARELWLVDGPTLVRVDGSGRPAERAYLSWSPSRIVHLPDRDLFALDVPRQNRIVFWSPTTRTLVGESGLP